MDDADVATSTNATQESRPAEASGRCDAVVMLNVLFHVSDDVDTPGQLHWRSTSDTLPAR